MRNSVTIVPGLLICCLLPTIVGAQQNPQVERPKIIVSGESVVYVRPDKIVINLGIETMDKDIQVAKQQNNDIQRKAMAAIKETGVASKEVQTDHLSIEPRYRSEHRKEDFIGYFVRNSLLVTLGDAEKVEDLITKVLAAGITHIHGIDFQTTQFKQHREQARELALKAAKEKAEKMAGVLGQKVGGPVQIHDAGSPSWYHSSWSGWGYGRHSGMSQNAVQNVAGGGGDVSETVALGKIGIRASVSVTFELR